MPEVFTNDQIIDQLQHEGEPKKWFGGSVEYTIPDVTPTTGSTLGRGFVNMTDDQRDFARQAFDLWDDLIGIDLNEVGDRQADITMALSAKHGSAATTSTDSVSLVVLSTDIIADADIWLGTDRDGLGAHDTIDYGVLGYRSMVHEVGHALGLSHPGPYDASDSSTPGYATDAVYAQDTRQYSIMSYFDAGEDGSGANHEVAGVMQWASTPLLHDIMAIQALYGADMTTRTGNTTYGFHSNAGRDAFNFELNRHPVVAIWDAGGNDTLDVSGFIGRQVVNLKSGVFSDVGGLEKNLVVAYGATIENAVGGAYNDILNGNNVANRLTGNDGKDLLSGAGGSDTLAGGSGSDTLIGGTGDDTLNGGTGSDTMIGGLGDDVYYVDTATRWEGPVILTAGRSSSFASAGLVLGGAVVAPPAVAGDKVVEQAREGHDLVRSSIDFSLSANLEDLALIGTFNVRATGNAGGNTLTGNAGANKLFGMGGRDSLLGKDGNDTLIGGAGHDAMEGGLGRDTFDFNRVSDSAVGTNRDTIIRFRHSEGDRIDLSTIDAMSGGKDNTFVFIGTESFASYRANHAGGHGLVRAVGGVNGLVQVDVNGNGTVDMEIKVAGFTLLASDFIL